MHIIDPRSGNMIVPVPFFNLFIHGNGCIIFFHGLNPAGLHRFGQSNWKRQVIFLRKLKTLIGVFPDGKQVGPLHLKVPHQWPIGKTRIIKITAVPSTLDCFKTIVDHFFGMTPRMHVTPYYSVHSTSSSKGVRIHCRQVASQILISKGLLKFSLLS